MLLKIKFFSEGSVCKYTVYLHNRKNFFAFFPPAGYSALAQDNKQISGKSFEIKN